MIPLDVNLERYLEDAPGIPIGHPLAIQVSKLTVKAYDRKNDQTMTITGDMHQIQITMLPSEADDRELGTRLDDAATGNRWAAFTDDELEAIRGGLFGGDMFPDFDARVVETGLDKEITAELERRKT